MNSEGMKAIIWTQYGPPEALQLAEMDKPVPEDDQVLIRIQATTVTAGDCEMRRLQLPLGLSFPIRLYAGLSQPKRIPVLGQELAGVIEAVGKDVNNYQEGDQVFGTTGFGFGAYAEYICLPANPDDAEGVLAIKPNNLTFEEAAAVPTAGLEALHYLKNANLQSDDNVLIIGAGGSIGTFAVQLAKMVGADVTGVDRAEKADLIRSLGADRFIDYTTEEFTREEFRYDLIVDVVGARGLNQRLKLLATGGNYFLAYAKFGHIFLSLWTSLKGRKRLRIESADQTKGDLNELKDLIEKGVLKSVIDRTYPLEEIAEAHLYCESGMKKGNVAISIG
jgi:NADPH:quinone reductase-like Zn-dependent oxidoreductase